MAALRTIEDLENDNKIWQELTGGDRSKLKNYFNVEFHLLLEDKKALVLSNFDNVCFVVSFCIIYTLNVSTSSFLKLNIIYT